MTRTHVTSEASDAADGAARAAGIEIRELRDLADLNAISRLFDDIWTRAAGDPLIRADFLQALTMAGNLTAAAYAGGEMIGGLTAYLGYGDGHVLMHSHILGVRQQSRGVGFALKQFQRAWCLERGITHVEWTFDPLVARNARFNLSKLGAVARVYHVNLYGAMDDAINAGDETDRLVADWDLSSDRAVAAARGEPLEVEPVIEVAAPDDIVALRRDDIDQARSWRAVVRNELTAALADGYVASGFRDGRYLLTKP